MDDPVSRRLLSDALLHESFLAAEELHGQLVVRRLEESLKLVADERRLGLAAHVGRSRTRSGFFLWRPVQADVVSAAGTVAEMNSSASGGKTSGRTSAPAHSAATTSSTAPGTHFFIVDKIHVVGAGHQRVGHERRSRGFVL